MLEQKNEKKKHLQFPQESPNLKVSKKGNRGLNYNISSNTYVILSCIDSWVMRKPKGYSRHHLLPTSRWWATVPKNLEIIPDMNHKAIHQLFVNQLIAEQLITTINISAKALRPEVKEWLLEVLQSKDISNPELWYKEECIK